MNLHEIKEELERRRDEKYREFSLSLTKDSALPMLGVRLPQLRAMAAVIAKEDARGFLESCDFSSMEMTTLYGFVLGRLRGEIGEATAGSPARSRTSTTGRTATRSASRSSRPRSTRRRPGSS